MKRLLALLMVWGFAISGSWGWDCRDCPQPEDSGGGEVTIPVDDTDGGNQYDSNEASPEADAPIAETAADGGDGEGVYDGESEAEDWLWWLFGDDEDDEDDEDIEWDEDVPWPFDDEWPYDDGGDWEYDYGGEDSEPEFPWCEIPDGPEPPETGPGGGGETGGQGYEYDAHDIEYGGGGTGGESGGSGGAEGVDAGSAGEGTAGGGAGESGGPAGPAETGGESVVDVATGMLIDCGLGEGTTVLAVQEALQGLLDGVYDGAGMPTPEELVQKAIESSILDLGADPGSGIDEAIGEGLSGIAVQGGEQLLGLLAGNPAANPWSTIAAAQQKVENWAAQQINSWIAKNPGLKKWFDVFGINGKFVVDGLKNIWGILTSNGTLQQKLAQLAAFAQNKLCDMVANAIRYGMQKVAAWLSNIANKIVSKIVNWIVGKIQSLFGIKIPTGIIQKVQAELSKLVGKGIAKVVVFDPEIIVGRFRPHSGTPNNTSTVLTTGGGGTP